MNRRDAQSDKGCPIESNLFLRTQVRSFKKKHGLTSERGERNHYFAGKLAGA